MMTTRMARWTGVITRTAARRAALAPAEAITRAEAAITRTGPRL